MPGSRYDVEESRYCLALVGYAGTEADHFDQGSQSSRVSRNVGSAPMSSKEIRSTEEQDKEGEFGIRAFFRPVGPIAFSTEQGASGDMVKCLDVSNNSLPTWNCFFCPN